MFQSMLLDLGFNRCSDVCIVVENWQLQFLFFSIEPIHWVLLWKDISRSKFGVGQSYKTKRFGICSDYVMIQSSDDNQTWKSNGINGEYAEAN